MSALAASVLLLAYALPASATEPVDFGRDVRPILSDNCFHCHGPDADARQADLRLDVRQAAIDSGAIAPGDPAASEILSRILSDDPEVVMPPPATGKKLTPENRQTLQRWIAQGADYEAHWAFVPPRRPVVPSVQDNNWVRNPIDAFVLQRLEQRGWKPAPPADPITLLRRLSLDLTGLPPAPTEIDACLATDEPLTTWLDDQLNSQHFGEKWARWWLDAARYADSDGYEKDKQRSVWFYRDWVIEAFNRNMPYDQFVIQQIAGDLLPNAGQSERVATGFLRNSMVNEEGGADPEQFRVEGMFDRLDAIGKAILGITTQCAQCHTHKFDPLSQREYYQMFAALNDFHEATISVFTPRQARQRDAVLQRIAELEASVKDRIPDWQPRLATWEEQTRQQLTSWRALTPTDIPYEGQKFRLLDDGSIVSESYAPTKTSNSFSLELEAGKITAFRLDALTHPQLPRGGPGRSIYGTGAVTEFEVAWAPADQPDKKQTVKLTGAWSDVNPPHSRLPAAFRDRDPEKDERVTGPIEYAIDGDAKTAWSTDLGAGRRNHDRHAIFFPETPLEHAGPIRLWFTLKQQHGGWNSDDNQNYLLGRYRFSIAESHSPESLVPTQIEQILLTPPLERTAEAQAHLFSYWQSTLPELAELHAEIEAQWEAFPEVDSQLVVSAQAEPRPTYIFNRGDFLNPGEPVEPGTPQFLGEIETTAAAPRLQFAQWLVRRDAPTTARAIVNRIWQAYFGRGLVVSPEDFGYQSPPPSHPQLLDWLAVELMDSGWDLKHIHRLIVDSATYRQSSVLDSQTISRDPENVWLARGPRLRVDAEIVRDIALTASGLLQPTVGGPSVYPPAPDFLFQPPASYGPKIWNTSSDGDQYRRSLYIHSYRSVPYPALQVFDAPKGDAACIRRERSNTPLQALVMLNEPQFVDCARAMASRVFREAGPDDHARLQHAFRLVVSRPPQADELLILQQLLEQQRQRVREQELDTESLLGASPALVQQLSGASAEELVPWFVVMRALLNLDETITKQ